MRLSLAESEQEVGCFYGLASLVKHATPAIKAAPLEDSEVFFVECFHHFNGLPFAAVPTKKKKNAFLASEQILYPDFVLAIYYYVMWSTVLNTIKRGSSDK